MSNRITLLMSETNIRKAKKIAAKRGRSVSKIVEDYIVLLDKIEQRLKKDELHPFVKEFGGIVNTGKDETKKTILAKRFEK
jgi:GR25 family glycosyltransferase involved in LPS biosynthesis